MVLYKELLLKIMLHGCGCEYCIQYGAGAVIRRFLKTLDTDVAIYNKLLYKNINKLYNK
jgi:hypothetical protein